MINFNLNFTNEQTILETVQQLAERIANNGLLVINENHYRIMDFEFYIKSPEFQDPHTYAKALQYTKGSFYAHRTGLDITWGNEHNAVGILIRGLAKIYRSGTQAENIADPLFIKEYFEGPHACRTEIVRNLKLNSTTMSNFEYVPQATGTVLAPFIHLAKSKRIGLTPKAEDSEHRFMEMELRYAVLTQRFDSDTKKGNGNPAKIKDAERLIKNLLFKGEINTAKAIAILGYLPKQG